MLISAQLKASNLVYTGSITVDMDSLESAYIKAYGEPLLPIGGDIPYTPITGSPDVLSFNLSTDIGTVTGGGVATIPGLCAGGFAIQGRGGMPLSPITLDGFCDSFGLEKAIGQRLILVGETEKGPTKYPVSAVVAAIKAITGGGEVLSQPLMPSRLPMTFGPSASTETVMTSEAVSLSRPDHSSAVTAYVYF
jgi:hypothetical protein